MAPPPDSIQPSVGSARPHPLVFPAKPDSPSARGPLGLRQGVGRSADVPAANEAGGGVAEVALQVPPARLNASQEAGGQGVQRKATLLDLLDRVLGKGVVAYGDIILSIADLDLVYLNLRAVLSSIGTLEKDRDSSFVDGDSKENNPQSTIHAPRFTHHDSRTTIHAPRAAEPPTSLPPTFAGGAPGLGEETKSLDSSFVVRDSKDRARGGRRETGGGIEESSFQPPASSLQSPGKLELDPQKTAKGLAKLVLTLINLLRKLMERQAIRRMEAGTLTLEQLERAGQAFKRLNDEIENLRKQFNLKEEDLNLDLGPLGKLM